MDTLVFQMKTLQNFYSFVTLIFEYEFRKVKQVNGRNIINGLCKHYFLNKKNILKRSFKITVNALIDLKRSVYLNKLHLHFFFFTPISGMCLFLYRQNSLVDAMSCRTFMKGCPDVSYFSDEIFKCKHIQFVEFLLLRIDFSQKHVSGEHIPEIRNVKLKYATFRSELFVN